MTELTNPARELAEIAKHLNLQSNKPGANFLAAKFEVDPWSTEFFKIITCIMERADLVGAIIDRSSRSADEKESAALELDGFKDAFRGGSLNNRWDNSGSGQSLMQDHGRVILHFSDAVSREIQYPKLSGEEVEELVGLIDAYLNELKRNGDGPDFVIRSIEDGLRNLRFQLVKIGWVGAGYTLQTFRQVVGIYEMSARYMHETNPDAGVWLAGLAHLATKFRDKIKEAQEWADAGASLYRGYNAISGVALPLLIPHISA